MSLKDSIRFHVSFFISSIPIMFNTIFYFGLSLIHWLLRRGSSDAQRANGVSWYARKRLGHEYIKPGPNDYRSPCPALNTMANHGYIPRNGKNLTGWNLTCGLIDCYNLSLPLAAFLSWGGVLLLGQVGHISLHDLARHNRVEHDASLTHPNTPEGEEYAPTHSDPSLLSHFLLDARGGKFRAGDIARARVRREKEIGTYVTSVQQEIARGEVALVLQIFGGEEFAVPVDVIGTWWGEERLPDGWVPTRKTTLRGTVHWSSVIRHAMDALRNKEKAEEIHAPKANGISATNGVSNGHHHHHHHPDDVDEVMDRPRYTSTNGSSEHASSRESSEDSKYTSSPSSSASTLVPSIQSSPDPSLPRLRPLSGLPKVLDAPAIRELYVAAVQST